MTTKDLEDKSVNAVTTRGYLFQYAVAFSATLCLTSAALAFGWTSPTLPKLLVDNEYLKITPDESSWIVAVMTLGGLIAPLPSAYSMDRFGRKITLLVTAGPLLISWILILVAKSVIVLYIARIFCGISYAMVYSVLPLYLGEIASDKIRGSIGTLLTVMAKFGILYVYAIGPYVSIILMAYLAMIPIILFVALFIWMPESPYYLLGIDRRTDAARCLCRLRQLSEKEIEPELERMSVAVKKSKENRGTIKELLAPGNKLSLIIILGLAGAQQLCGSQAVIAYSHKIFEAIGSELGASESSIILGVVQLVTAGFSSSIVDRWGRRPLLLLSTSGATICNLIIAIYFLLEKLNVNVTTISWLPMLAVMIFIISYTIGLATVPFAILGEIFPKNIKAIASALYTLFASIVSFTVHKLFQVVTDDLGIEYTFFGFTVFTAFYVGFVYFLIPETKEKPLDVILDEINSRSRRRRRHVNQTDK